MHSVEDVVTTIGAGELKSNTWSRGGDDLDLGTWTNRRAVLCTPSPVEVLASGLCWIFMLIRSTRPTYTFLPWDVIPRFGE